MKTIIKITKQEAIDAWKDMNHEKVKGEDITVEIEDMSIGTGNFIYNPTMPCGFTTQCSVCGEYIKTATEIHLCRGYKVTC